MDKYLQKDRDGSHVQIQKVHNIWSSLFLEKNKVGM